ncbi:MAG: CopG family transcriptional regulator [Actinomycetota bacterium]
MKQRTQIQLDPEQAADLKRVAERRGVSMAAVVRDALDAYIARMPGDDERVDRAMSVVGRFSSGRQEVSERHDDEFVDAVFDR